MEKLVNYDVFSTVLGKLVNYNKFSVRFDLTTSSQRIYLKTNTKPCRQKWIIQLGTTKANISEEMPDVATVALASFNEHKSELKTVRLLLAEQIDTVRFMIV